MDQLSEDLLNELINELARDKVLTEKDIKSIIQRGIAIYGDGDRHSYSSIFSFTWPLLEKIQSGQDQEIIERVLANLQYFIRVTEDCDDEK